MELGKSLQAQPGHRKPSALLTGITGSELKAIREAYGLSASGVSGIQGLSQISRFMSGAFERCARSIPPSVAKLAWMDAHHGITRV